MADSEQPVAEQAPDSPTRAQQIEDQLAAEYSGEPEAQPETDQAKPEPKEADSPETSDGLEEVEFEGEQFQVPKKIKDGLLREADYRRKTQEIAKRRQDLDVQYQALERQNIERKFMEAVKEPVLEFNKLSAQIDQYRGLNWQTLPTEELLRARAEIDRLEHDRSKVAQAIEGRRGEFAKQQEQLNAELIRKSDEIVRQRIPTWSEETAKGVADYALSEGYSVEEVKAIVEPRHALTLWKAQQYDRLQSERGKTLTKVQNAQAKVVKPGPASKPMPAAVKEQFAFKKALKAANTSSQKARLIEDQLAAEYNSRR